MRVSVLFVTFLFFVLSPLLAKKKPRTGKESLFGKEYATYQITSNELSGACFYLVSGHGMPIFKDRKAAMKQAKKDYGLGFEYLREYRNFPKISDNPKVCQQYKMLGWQTVPPMTVENYEEIGRQCGMVSSISGLFTATAFGEDG